MFQVILHCTDTDSAITHIGPKRAISQALLQQFLSIEVLIKHTVESRIFVVDSVSDPARKIFEQV